MRRRVAQQSDSMEMLLDTMCNTFGGIILIALLIALLTNESRVTESEARRLTENSAMLDRRIEQARRELEQARAMQAELDRRVTDPAQANLLQLIDQRERLRRVQSAMEEALKAGDQELRAGDASAQARMLEKFRQLEAETRQAEQEMLDLRSRGENLQGQIAELRRGLQTESNRLAQVRARQTQRLRLPREHDASGRAHFYAILRHGKLYPLYVFQNGEPVKNTQSLRWQPDGGDTLRIEPIPEAGIRPLAELAAVETFFRQLPSDRVYVVFEVYADSFAEFVAAKEAAIRHGLEYTWEPRKRDAVIRLASSGEVPPPQ
jgi:hypothetical protein